MKRERRTRKEKIDHQRARAGWPVGSRRLIEELNVRAAPKVGEPTRAPGTPTHSPTTGKGRVQEKGRVLIFAVAKVKTRPRRRAAGHRVDWGAAVQTPQLQKPW